MAHRKPLEMFSKYPKIFDRLFSNLESNDLTIVSVSLDTLGIIGLSNEGKTALHSTGMMRFVIILSALLIFRFLRKQNDIRC